MNKSKIRTDVEIFYHLINMNVLVRDYEKKALLNSVNNILADALSFES